MSVLACLSVCCGCVSHNNISLSQLFEEYKRTFKKRAEEKKREKLRKAREDFIVMLSESREITKESRFASSFLFCFLLLLFHYWKLTFYLIGQLV